MDLKELLHLLEERLVQHDENRKEVQKEMHEVCVRASGEADALEEKLNGEIRRDFDETEERVLGLIDVLSTSSTSGEDKDHLDGLMDWAQEELAIRRRYEIKRYEYRESFADSYKLNIATFRAEKGVNLDGLDDDASRIEFMVGKLQEKLRWDNEFMTAAQGKVTEICNNRRRYSEGFERKINEKLEPLFSQEDARLQEVVSLLRKNVDSNNSEEELREVARKAKEALFVNQKYSLSNLFGGHSLDDYDLSVAKEVSLKYIDFEGRKPTDFVVSSAVNGEVSFSFAFFSADELDVLRPLNLSLKVELSIWEKDLDEGSAKTLTTKYIIGDSRTPFGSDVFASSTTYCLKMRIENSGSRTKWSDIFEFTTSDFRACCAWKECPDYVFMSKKYSLDEFNPRIAIKNSGDNYVYNWNYCTVIANTPLPACKVTSWNVRAIKTRKNDGSGICIGVAPFDIDQNGWCNHEKCGWYLNSFHSKLYSGPPHNYRGEDYGPKKGEKEAEGCVGVIMDTRKSKLSFSIRGVNYGTAYEEIPLDKPLVPCVILGEKGYGAELDLSKVKKFVLDSSVPIPANITTKSDTWDSITLAWDPVEGASFYQVKIDKSKFWDSSSSNEITKRGFLPGAKHKFRVRTVVENSVSEWSDVVKGITSDESLETSWWKECPDGVKERRKYSADEENPRIVRKIGDYGYSTVVGNTALTLNQVASWTVKILKSKDNNCIGIYIGVAPFDIDQNADDNYEGCGWYFNCFNTTLRSGPPHDYNGRKWGDDYVQVRECVGVVMDTTRGDLSFIVDGVNLGVAYEGIPLDKPLVPCVLLGLKDDSVELDTSGAEEKTSDSVSVPSRVKAKCNTWDSITLTWDAAEGASFYQVEVDEDKSYSLSKANSFVKKGLLQETEHTFRVRTVRGNNVSEWCDDVKIKTPIESFETSWWRECPENVDDGKKYTVDFSNPRVATKIGSNRYCTIIWNAPIPLNKVTSWGIKILKSLNNNGYGINIGVAPSDINQNENLNHEECGWYFECFSSTLWSGPPHNYLEKKYHSKKKNRGMYVHEKDLVGVVIDTEKGELSFVLNGVSLGLAYSGIPLDKPLIPCVLLRDGSDSVKFCPASYKLPKRSCTIL